MEEPLIDDENPNEHDHHENDIEIGPEAENAQEEVRCDAGDGVQDPDLGDVVDETNASNRELLDGPIKRSRLRMKRFWCGCCCASTLILVLMWFVIFLPTTRWIITNRAKSAPIDVRRAFVHIDETHPVIYCDSMEVVVPKRAWDMGFALRWISFTAKVPPVNATMYAHLPNGTIVQSGVFESKSKMTMHSWEDMHANFTGVLHPNMSVLKDFFMMTITQPQIKVHISTMVTVSATVFGFLPVTIPNIPLVSAVLSIDAMNNFRNSTVKLDKYVRVIGAQDTLTLVVKAVMNNPTPFGCRMDGRINMDAFWRNGGQLGTLHMNNMSLLPKPQDTMIEASFDYILPTTQLDRDAFNEFLHVFMGDPKGFEPSGTKPIMVSAGPPKRGFPVENPMLQKVFTPDVRLNTTMTPIPFTPLQAVNVTVPLLTFWKGATVVFRMYNPLPAVISIDTVVMELYYLNLTGPHLYTFNHTFAPKSKLVAANNVSDISIDATLDGIDYHSVREILGELVKRGLEHDVPVGVRGNFTITVLPSFKLTIPYTNAALDSKIIFKGWGATLR